MTTIAPRRIGSEKLSRRSLLKAIPALTLNCSLFAQATAQPIAVRKLHSFGLRVADVGRSLKFYQDLFAAPVQSRQGETVCLRIGDGPGFFSLSPIQSGHQPGISHIGLSVENFTLAAVRDQLDGFGISRHSATAPTQASLDMAMKSWITTRGRQEGGSASGTEELFFADVEGLIYQLAPEDHCGGSGESGTEPTNFTGECQIGAVPKAAHRNCIFLIRTVYEHNCKMLFTVVAVAIWVMIAVRNFRRLVSYNKNQRE